MKRLSVLLILAASIGAQLTPGNLPLSAYGAPVITRTPATMAGLGSLDHGGVFAPVIAPMSQAQLEDHARRLDAYRLAVAQHAAKATMALPFSNPGNYGGLSAYVVVTAYAEPNLYAYRNYCGPGASQVLISDWTSNVPSIDTLATQEKTNPNSGTLFSNMVGPINSDVGQTFYGVVAASSQTAFNNYVGGDTWASGRPLMTAIYTQGNNHTLNGWTLPAAHIVTIYGFNFQPPGAGTISYVETAGTVSGTSATGKNAYNDDSFWSLVTLNNGQIW